MPPPLPHRATLQRRQGTQTLNDYGRDNRPYTDFETLVPCFLQSLFAIEKVTLRSDGVVDETFIIFFAKGQDVGEADRISVVSNIDGDTLAKNIDITGIRKVPGRDGRIDHIEASGFLFREGVTVTWQET